MKNTITMGELLNRWHEQEKAKMAKLKSLPKTDLSENIKNWYIANFPNDELGNELNEHITFDELLEILKNGFEVYEFLGVGDSIIRERCFARLAELMQVDYDEIYDMWL